METSNGSATQPVGEQIPKWAQELRNEFSEYRNKSDARLSGFGKDIARFREESKSKSEGSGQAGAKPDASAAALSPIESVRFARMMARLPDKAQTELETLLEDPDLTPREAYKLATRFADVFSKIGAGNTDPDTKSSAPEKHPQGEAATAAPNHVHHTWPKTQAEFAALRVSDPKKYERLMANPSFSPLKLPKY